MADLTYATIKGSAVGMNAAHSEMLSKRDGDTEHGVPTSFDCMRRLQTPIWVYDTDSRRIAYANNAACEIWEASTEAELTARDLSKGMSKTVAERLEQFQMDFLTQDVKFEETWTLFPGDAPVTLNVVYSGFYLPDGRMGMMCEVIGRCTQTTETLRSTQALLHTDVAIALFSAEGRAFYKNPSAHKALPNPETKLKDIFLHFADYETCLKSCEQTGEFRRVIEVKAIDKMRWIDLIVKQCLDAVTGEQALLVSAFDVTRSKSIKAASDIYQEQLATTFSAALDGIVIIDAHGFVLKSNESFLTIFGFEETDILNQKISDIILPFDGRDGFHQTLSAMLERKASEIQAKKAEIETICAQGNKFVCEIAISKTRSPNGSVFIIYIRDISKAKAVEAAILEAKEAAETANRAKSEFLANMSHEIRTPMNGVLGMIDVLKQTELTKRQRKCIDIIYRSGDNLMTIIGDILDFSKIEAGKTEIHLVEGNLRSNLQSVLNLQGAQDTARHLSLNLNYSPDLTEHFLADFSRIEQIVSNLVNNGIKFTAKGSVSIKVSGDVAMGIGHIVIVITDTGIGIPEDKLEHIFEKFSQAEASTTRQYGGTGLGLSISRGLAEAMGGTLTVKSRVGRGTRFKLRLALQVVEPPESAITIQHQTRSIRVGEDAPKSRLHRQRAAQNDQTYKLLIAEDVEINQIVLSALLDHDRIDISFAQDGLKAVEAFKSGSFDLIFMDASMPILDGVSATKAIRNHEEKMRKPRTPIICLSAHVTEAERTRFTAAGMDDFLGKPVVRSKLYQLISKWLAASKNSPKNDEQSRTHIAPPAAARAQI